MLAEIQPEICLSIYGCTALLLGLGRFFKFLDLLHTICPLNLALTSPTSGGRSVGIFRLRTTGQGIFLFDLFFYTVGRTPWKRVSPSQGRYLHTEQQKHKIKAHTDIHALRVGFEPTIPVLGASEDGSCLRPATGIGIGKTPRIHVISDTA
jgi:hypothetical protein